MICSSSLVQSPFLIEGSRWLNQRSLHCLPILPGSFAAIDDHFTFPTPCFMTISITIESSSFVQVPLCKPGYVERSSSNGIQCQRHEPSTPYSSDASIGRPSDWSPAETPLSSNSSDHALGRSLATSYPLLVSTYHQQVQNPFSLA